MENPPSMRSPPPVLVIIYLRWLSFSISCHFFSFFYKIFGVGFSGGGVARMSWILALLLVLAILCIPAVKGASEGNVSFECSPFGPCIPCQYAEQMAKRLAQVAQVEGIQVHEIRCYRVYGLYYVSFETIVSPIHDRERNKKEEETHALANLQIAHKAVMAKMNSDAENEVATVHSLSGTSSLRLAAAVIQRYFPDTKVLISSPTMGCDFSQVPWSE